MIYNRLLTFSGFAVLLSGCTPEEEINQAESEIVNGLEDPGHPSVVRVFAEGVTAPTPTTPACTGVLIYHNTVLTAAHCVTEGAYQLVAFAGGGGFIGIAHRHGDYEGYNGAPHDLATIKTFDKKGRPFYAKIAQGVALGMQITLVGYGRTGTDPQDGVKRFGTNVIDSVDPEFFYFNSSSFDGPAGEDVAICSGDSGGPAFLGGPDSDCVGGIAKGNPIGASCEVNPYGWYHTRVDNASNIQFIASQVPVQFCAF